MGSQNFDHSAFGDYDGDLDLVEYSVGVENTTTVSGVNSDFIADWNNSGKLWVANQGNLETVAQISESGDVILIDSGVYEISNTISIKEGVTFTGSDVVFRPSSTFSGQSLLQITDDNIIVSGLVIQDSPGYGIEIGDGVTAFENINISRVVFANNALGSIHVQSPANGDITSYTIENNTFVGDDYGVTISANANSTGTIRNNIFAGQSIAPIQIASADDGSVEYSYNLFYDCAGGSCADPAWHIGNLGTGSSAHDNLFDLDPLFANFETGDYQLSPASPAS